MPLKNTNYLSETCPSLVTHPSRHQTGAFKSDMEGLVFPAVRKINYNYYKHNKRKNPITNYFFICTILSNACVLQHEPLTVYSTLKNLAMCNAII